MRHREAVWRVPPRGQVPDGHYSQCRPCKRAQRKAWEVRKRAESHQWVERRKAFEREYRQRTQERRLARMRAYYRDSRDADVQVIRLSRIVAAHRARARECGAEGSFTTDDVLSLFERYGHRRLACGVTDRPLTVDHVVPLALGGRNDAGNLQPLCRPCNTRKMQGTTDFRPDRQEATAAPLRLAA